MTVFAAVSCYVSLNVGALRALSHYVLIILLVLGGSLQLVRWVSYLAKI